MQHEEGKLESLVDMVAPPGDVLVGSGEEEGEEEGNDAIGGRWKWRSGNAPARARSE